MSERPEVTQEKVLEALSSVKDPDKQRDVVSLGMVSGLAVKQGHVTFALQVEPERGAKLEPLRKEAEKVVDGIPGVLSVTAVLTAHNAAGQAKSSTRRPPTSDAANAPYQGNTAGSPLGEPDRGLVPHVKHIIAVASGKGGVGKSTTAVNIALALVAQGHKVGLMDADIYGPSLPRMLGLGDAQPESHDGETLSPLDAFGLKCMSMGFLVPEESPIIWRGPMVMTALQQLLRDVNWGELDVMVVDLPPGTGDAQLTMAQQVPLAGAVIVSTPQDIALIDARKGLNMFRKVDVPVLGIVENMSYFLCPSCGSRAEIFGHGGAREEAGKLGTEFLGEVPLHMTIRETSDGGRPVVVTEPDGDHAKAYKAIAEKIWAQLTREGARPQGPRLVVS